MKLNQCVFEEMNRHLCEDAEPSIFFDSKEIISYLSGYPFNMLNDLKKTMQSPKHHPEGSVWNHTMLVIDAAAQMKQKSSDSRVFMWAALLHDIGKPAATKVRNGKITSYDHDKLGAELAKNFLEYLHEEKDFIDKVASLVRWHMQILFVLKSLSFSEINKMQEQTNVMDIALLGLCDRLGRYGADKEKEYQNINMFLEKCGYMKQPDIFVFK